MADIDTGRLAEFLRVLANENRLDLLHQLRRPRAVSEIALRPLQVHEGENPQRPISHQAVRDHLAKLAQIGVIAVERTERDGHLVDEYVLNHARLFAIVEELRALGELRATAEPDVDATVAATPRPGEPAGRGPRLILVRGQGEGREFPLRADRTTPGRGWVIGRKRGLAVSLDYDPFVSTENAEIVSRADGFDLVDIRSSRNGTQLNFRPVPRGSASPLRSGDIITIGRTSLVFRLE